MGSRDTEVEWSVDHLAISSSNVVGEPGNSGKSSGIAHISQDESLRLTRNRYALRLPGIRTLHSSSTGRYLLAMLTDSTTPTSPSQALGSLATSHNSFILVLDRVRLRQP